MKKIILVMSSFLVLSACTFKDKNPVQAIVNGVEIRKSEIPDGESLDVEIKKVVMQTEAKRLRMTKEDLLSFFDVLKTRKISDKELDQFVKKKLEDKEIKSQTQDEILNLLREQQYEAAKDRYISELMSRSTIWLMQDGQKVKYPIPQKSPSL